MRGIIPLPQSDMNEFVFNAGSRNIITNVSSNGYYGYQPQINATVKNSVQNGQNEQLTNENCDTDMDYNHLEEINVHLQNNIPRQYNRKRRWEQAGEVVTFKKRREYDQSSYYTSDRPMQSAPVQTAVHLRKPTHNIPDLPRCLMEDNKSNLKSELPKGDKEDKLLEDILQKTHGTTMYHWLSDEA